MSDVQKLEIGCVHTTPQQRDCIHMAIMPCVCGEGLYPGVRVNLLYGTTDVIVASRGGNHIGIVDPFLELPEDTVLIQSGQRVWVFLKPGSITGLRHDWDAPCLHPDTTGDAEKWLRQFAQRWHFDYDEMIQEATQEEGCIVADGVDLHGASELAAGEEDCFWTHVETITGKKFNAKHRKFFRWSCSC